ncbi:GntR family transcriptional regulator [Saccharothrix syringae]|uniref:GntR family transcriptional regulator n=2 Tax=Saccharothrix syringae TaxID=103733 RepID=A0A5Q0HEM2_SACSY|nr:GntR family transcriptional regulator [Saccharothrix syringae]
MTPPAQRPEPPYRRIVAAIRARITAGELRAGEPLPSIRRIARDWDVAIATATKAVAVLRDTGLVETRVGAGTVVSAHATRPRRGKPTAAPPLDHVVRTAIAIADAEGLDALSMRRLAAELDVGPMSLYRHVANKDDLVARMVDAVFTDREPPDPGPDGWRAKLELIARLQWEVVQQHLWLPRVISFTRPPLVPGAMAHTEWTLRALDGLDLPAATKVREAITLPALVMTSATTLAAEVEAGHDRGETFDLWWEARRSRTAELLDSDAFPLLAAVPQEVVADLDGLFEYALARHLDGFAALLEGRSADF